MREILVAIKQNGQDVHVTKMSFAQNINIMIPTPPISSAVINNVGHYVPEYVPCVLLLNGSFLCSVNKSR